MKASIIGIGLIGGSFALTLKEKGIAVNCLALGSAQTEMFSAAFPAFKAAVSAKQMATFVAEFAVNGSNYFNGKVIPVSNSTP